MSLEKFININWYMERKPYSVHTAIDIFYLKICRDLYTLIAKMVRKYDDVVDLAEDDCRELAYVFTAYFEDRVNEIGFWQSLTATHKKLFGKRLPFFDAQDLQQQEKQWEDILPADIHYLAYVTYLQLLTDDEEKTIVYFNKPFFTELSKDVFQYLDEKEEVLTTDFYESFLVPAEDYFDFKQQMDWFTFNGYLTAISFNQKLDDIEWKLMEEDTDPSMIDPVMYGERDRLLFEVPSLYTAIFPVDMLAGAMRCSPKKKEEISNLKWRPHGIFHVQQETETHYWFLHTSTGEEFKVVKSSFKETFDSRKEDEYQITTLAKWNDEYNISGLCIPCPYKGEEIYHRNFEMQHSFQKHFGPFRLHLEQTARDYRQEAVKFFGRDFMIFNTGYLLQEKLNEFLQWHFDTITDKTKLPEETKPGVLPLPEELLKTSKIALFIPPVDNMQFITRHEQLLHVLQTRHPNKITLEKIEEVLPMLLDDSIGADYWFYLKKNFAIPNLSLFLKCPAETEEDFEAILRIYRPEDFSPLRLPRFTTFTSERISHEKIRELLRKKSDDF
jgi:hypothetical protein